MPDAAPDAPRPPRAQNNTRQLETVSRNRQLVGNVLNDDEALALATRRKQTRETLTAGLAVADAFLKTYGTRDAATGTRTKTRKGLKAADKTARDLFNDLRSTLRTEYDGQPEHLQTLGVAAYRAAPDRDAFLDEARSTVAAARRAPYAAALALVEWDATALDALGVAVDDLEAAASGGTSATGTHGGSTGARNAAYAAFMGWIKPTRKWLGLAFRDHPAVARRVGLAPRG